MVLAVVVDGHRIVTPRDAGLEAVEPWLAKDGVEAVEGGGVEGVSIRVGREGEALPREEEGAGLSGAIDVADDVRCEFGGNVEAVAAEEGGVDEVAIAAGIDEEGGGVVVDEAVKDEKVGAGGVEVEGGGR